MTSRRSIHNKKDRNSPTPPPLNFYELRIQKYSEQDFHSNDRSFNSFRDRGTDDDDETEKLEIEANDDDPENFESSFSKSGRSSSEEDEESTKILACSRFAAKSNRISEKSKILEYLNSEKNKIILAKILIIIALVIFAIFGFKKFHSSDDIQHRFQIFETKLNDMKKIYPNQVHRNPNFDIKSWTKIKAAVRSFFEQPEKRDQSVIILLLSDDDVDQSKSAPFADSLVELFYMTSYSKINQSNLTLDSKNFEPVNLMFRLGDLVEKFYDEKIGLKSPIFYQIRSLELLIGRTPLIFHHFCDNTKFKNAIFVLALKCEKFNKNWDKMADECLKSIWLADGQLDLDKISPLLSRIAVNVIYVR